MKEAAGEANMTVITIVMIGIVAAIGIPLLNSILSSSQGQSCCVAAGGHWSGNTCSGPNYDAATYNACMESAETD